MLTKLRSTWMAFWNDPLYRELERIAQVERGIRAMREKSSACPVCERGVCRDDCIIEQIVRTSKRWDEEE